MGPPQLWLLLLLSSGALTQDDGLENANPACSRDATRFKHFRKYVYNYEAETRSGVSGTADSRSGSKIKCKVEVEVPQLCHFILKTSQCTLGEVSGIDAEGKALSKKSKNSDEFGTAMSRHDLKFIIQDGKEVQLYPEDDEATHILNIKRGIISALIVPMETEDNAQTLSMDTVYGKCDSDVEVRERKGNVAENITIGRNLKYCDNFSPIRDYVSPIAFIKGLNKPLSTLISSTQNCEYKIDVKKKHVTGAVCNEKHLFLPSSYKNQYGMMAEVTQTLVFTDTLKINNRDLDVNGLIKRGLALEGVETKSSRHGDAVLKVLQELQKLSISEQNQKRASLFYRFVTGLRSLHNSTLGPLVPRLMETSSAVTIQALAQCGTPECFGAILQVLRTDSVDPLVADVITYSLGLLPSPCPKRIRELLNMAQYHQSRNSFFALSHAVNNFYWEKGVVTTEINDVASFMTSVIGNQCSGDKEFTYQALKAIGNMGNAMENTNSNVKHFLKTCIRNQGASPLVQKAAIQALRKMTITDEDQGMLVRVFQDASNPADKRLAAYLMLMRNPSPSDVSKVVKVLLRDKSEQVKSFVASHIANILESDEPGIELLKGRVQEALKETQVPTAKDFQKFSQNYQVSKTLSIPGLDPVSGKVEGNLLFDSTSYIPKESMLKTTLQLYGLKPVDLFEIGLDGKGFEPSLEALFGPKGFFPDSASKALYWVNGKIPDQISQALGDYFGYSKDGGKDQDVMKGIVLNFEKLVKELTSKEAPEARAYLRILGEELGYLKFNDFKLLGNVILRSFKTLQTMPEKIANTISTGAKNDLFVHYIFMDNEFELPTGAGLQLQVALSGIATPGAKAGVKVVQKSVQAELMFKPSASIEFVTHIGVNIPEFARNGVQMNTNIYHESGTEARIGLRAGQFKVTIPAPKSPTKLFSISNVLHLVTPTRMDVIPPLIENREFQTSCRPFFVGFNFCTRLEYSNASSTEAAPRYPLTGETRFELEIQPTGQVKEYTASVNYEVKKEEMDLVDTLKFIAQAEGARQGEATLTFRYNRNKRIFTSDLQVPSFNIDVGTNFRITDVSTQEKNLYTFILDVNNKKISEVTLTGQIGYANGAELLLGTVISIPRLQTQARTDALLQKSQNGIMFQIDSSATAHGSSISDKIVLRYDNEKVEVQWDSGISAALKKMSIKLPVDFQDYSQALQKHANGLLDYQVANTDITLRHIVSHFIVATNTWLQQSSGDIPYAQRLQDKLSKLQELDFQIIDLSTVTIPEELFLKRDGQIKYTWNKENAFITIPLPFGGRSSKDMNVPQTVKTPQLIMVPLGVNMPSQEYRLPPFTIPESYTFRVPLLGTFDISSNVYSNYYNWSAAFSLANTTKEALGLKTNYFMKADSSLELLSYNIQSEATATYDEQAFICDYKSLLEHSLLQQKFTLSNVQRFGPSAITKISMALEASSLLGAQLSLSAGIDSKYSNNLLVHNANMEGQLKVSSAFAKTTYTFSGTSDRNSLMLAGESNLKFDSSFLQATNQMTGRYAHDAWTIMSISNVQNGFLTNTASLKYENSQLKLASETAGSHRDFAALNKFELTLAKQAAALRSEYQASYIQNRYYTLLLGSVSGQGVELNADVSVSGERNRAAHKSSLSINQDGLASSATTNMQFSPLTLGSEMNARIGTSGASMVINTNGRYGKHNAKFTLDGRAALAEVVLGSVCQGSLLDMDGKNTLNFRVNKEGLKFTNSLIGSYKATKLEHTQDLNIAGLSLAYTSNLDHTIGPDKSHKHRFEFQLQPYSLTANVNNDLKYSSAEVINKARLQLEPLKVNLDGNVKGAYQGNEVKHTYVFTYADLAANFKTNTLASIQGTALTHTVNLDVAGLSSSINVNTNYDSKSLRLSNSIRALMAPFTVTVDMHTNSNGRLMVLGEQTGQLYSKFLLKIEPLAFMFSHDYLGSTDHNLNSGQRYNTLLDNKVYVLFNPSEQTSTWKLKSQLNNNVYTQDLKAVNNAQKIGVELSGQMLADLSVLDFPISVPFTDSKRLNLIDTLRLRESVTEPQEFGLSLSVNYDKNSNMHVINLPFLENLPAYYEQLRQSILVVLKSIQKNLNSENIDQYLRKYKASLEKLPQQVNDYVNTFHLEGKMNYLKEKLDGFTKEYRISMDDLQLALENLQEALFHLQTLLVKAEKYIKENYDQYDLRAAIARLIEQIVEKMKVLDRQYEISVTMVNTIQQLQSAISQYDPSNLGSSVAAWVQNMDAEYKIKAQVQEKLDQLKSQIQSIDVQQIAERLKQQVEAIDIRAVVEKLKLSLPIEKINQIIEQLKAILLSVMEEYEVSEKINAVRAKIHELIVNYNIDQQAKFLMDKMIELSKQQKIKETIQKVTLSLKQIDIKSFFDQLMQFIDNAVQQLQTFDYKNLVDEVNKFLDFAIKKLKSFDYNEFVDSVNNKMQAATQKINEEIRALELPQKVEAAKRYIKEVQAVVSPYVEKLKDTRLAVLVDWFKDLLSSTTLQEVKTRMCDYLENVRDIIYQMNIQNELQIYLEKASQLYNAIITYLIDQWNIAAKKITLLAEKYDMKHVADGLNQFVETGFIVPEIRLHFLNTPAFEVSLRALQEATFQTPDYIIPLTTLRVPSYRVNMKNLKEIRIPARFTVPEFCILISTFKVPSFTIDLNEIKLSIVKAIDHILTSDFQLPVSDLYFKDLQMKDIFLFDFSFPEMDLPELQIPVILIPKLNLNAFQFPDVQIPEFQLPRIPHSVSVPTFGKLTGAFRVASPIFTLATNAGFENITAFAHSPEFVASFSALATSKFNYLAFTMTADARLLAPEMQQLILRESLKFSHSYLKTDHTGELVFSGTSVQGTTETTSRFDTARNAVELHNKLIVNLLKKISMESKTTYTHRLNVPTAYFTSQADLSNDMKTQLEAGRISVTSIGKGNWKWATLDYSDEGTHDSSVSFTVGGSVAALVAQNRINDKYLKVNQRLAYEYTLPSFSTLQVESTVESPQLGRSILNVQGTSNLAEMKTELRGTHNAKLSGRVSGTVNNDLAFLVQPFKVSVSTNNDGNLKVSFPLRLVGKIDFQNNYGLLLSPSMQQVSWIAEGRFNQYRYVHNMSASNHENSIEASVSMNGDANLDFLNIPLSFPEQSVPYIDIKTPQVQGYSLWEETGLKQLLKTTKQSFDLNLKAQYHKNKDMHAFQIPLDGVHKALSNYIVFFNKYFERGRDNALAFLTESYNQAKIKFDKYKVENSVSKVPQIFRIPGYTIPVVNIEVSPFTAELPAFGYVIPTEMSTPGFTVPLVGFSVPSYTLVLPSLELPVLYVPQGLRTLRLPSYRAHPSSNRIYIPALGNVTFDFSFKSSVITLSTNAGIFNQSDIIARLSSSSTSVIDALQYRLDGTTSLTRKRGLKLATALSLNNKFIEGNHDSTISLAKRNIETLVKTTAKINLPGFKANFGQELKGNTKSKPIISSAIDLNYLLDVPAYEMNGRGTVVHKLTLESTTSYISVDTSTNASINGVYDIVKPYSGKLVHEANGYLSAKNARSSLKFEINAKYDKLWDFDMKENVAVVASTRRVYAVWDHSGENNLQYPLISNGNQNCKATLELAPAGMSTNLQIQLSQTNNVLGEASVSQVFVMIVNTENQKIGWQAEGQILSLFLGHDLQLVNDKTKAQFNLAGSLGGHVDFLRRIVLPVYDRSLWDILKLDVTTRPGERQYLNASTAILYTKSEDGYFIPINVNQLADGFTFTIPEISVISTPVFNVPFTTLEVPSYTIDLREIKIPKRLSTRPFDIGLPSLPKLQFPQLDVVTSYVNLEEYKIPYLELTVPEYLLTISQFTLPKTLSLGNTIVDLNAAANKIADFELPTIMIPEQQIEIPGFKMALPAGIYFPKFGALTSSFKVASPVYSTTWKTDLKNIEGSLELVLDLTASSPLQFLEYDLDAVWHNAYGSGQIIMDGTGTFAHRDLSAKFKEEFNTEGYRLSLDITSPTFTDVQIRCEVQSSNTITLVSSSAGTLGFLLNLDSNILNGKFFYRTQSNPQNDVDVLKSEISFKNPELIQVKVNWNEDGAIDLLQGLKEKMPQIVDAVYRSVNTYHREHMGMEINMATLKLKDHLRNEVDQAYRDILYSINNLENQLHQVTNHATGNYEVMRQKGKRLYHSAADQVNQMDYDQIRAQFLDATMDVIVEYHRRVKHLIDSAIKFLKVTKFQVPGVPGKHTGEQFYVMATEKLTEAVDLCISKVQEVFDALIAFVNELEVKIPASSQIIKGSLILDEIKQFLTHMQNKVHQILVSLQEIDFAEHLRELKGFVQQAFQKIEELIQNLQTQNYEYLKAEIKQLLTKILQGLNSFATTIKYWAPRVENIIQNSWQSAYKKLEEFQFYMKDLRAEYFDPSMVGWSVKYYEMEERVLNWLNYLINTIVEWHARYISDAADLVSFLTDRMKEFVENYGKLTELSKSAHDSIVHWSEAVKRSAAEQNDQVKAKLQEAHEHLLSSYERLITETKRLIDLIIENYTAFLQYLQQLLDHFEQATADSLRPYIAVRQGELRIDIPKPFDLLLSMYQMPQLSDEVFRTKLELTRELIRQGIDQSSRKWEELQSFIDLQIAAGQLTMQQIKENVQERLQS